MGGCVLLHNFMYKRIQKKTELIENVCVCTIRMQNDSKNKQKMHILMQTNMNQADVRQKYIRNKISSSYTHISPQIIPLRGPTRRKCLIFFVFISYIYNKTLYFAILARVFLDFSFFCVISFKKFHIHNKFFRVVK